MLLAFDTLPTAMEGTEVITHGFTQLLPFVGTYIVPLCLPIFAFTTILGWSTYSEAGIKYAFGTKHVKPFRVFWCAVLVVGALNEAHIIWHISDTMFGLIVYPNIIAVLILSAKVMPYFKDDKMRMPRFFSRPVWRNLAMRLSAR